MISTGYIIRRPWGWMDISVQTLFILIALAGLFARLELLFYGQLMLGIWQVSGSILGVIQQLPAHRLKRWHLGASAFYVSILIFQGTYAFWLWTVPAWILAFFCYITSWIGLLPPRKRSSFLPNLSF